MKERPILFSGPMVRAILEGKKTETRRVIKPQPKCPSLRFYLDSQEWRDGDGTLLKCPYGVPGDYLWVRETHWIDWYPDGITDAKGRRGTVHYRACHPYPGIAKSIDGHWRPSIHMPRWASRLTPEVTGVRLERLQDITEEGIVAEGIHLVDCRDYKGWYNPVDHRYYPRAEWAFQYLWNSINAKRGFGWEVNPWVWVVSCSRADNGKENSP